MSNPKQHKDQLGKGIRSLLQSIDTDLKTTGGQLKPSVVETATASTRIAIADIEPNPKQPRRDFDDSALQQLAASIKQHDIIQPITVAKLAGGKYRLIAGERRWRAAKLAGLIDVPAYQRQANDQQLLELALLENLQREDLNAMEVALSYKRMMDELHFSQEQVADRMGKDRSTVANSIRLLKLPPDIQLAVRQGSLSMGHARALLAIELVDVQLYAFKEIMRKGLSVRQTETLVQQLKKDQGVTKKITKSSAANPLKRIEDKLASHFSTRVRIQQRRDGQGQLIIEYYSPEELTKILRQLNAPLD
jgi:ParB family chromosome partitioning protein